MEYIFDETTPPKEIITSVISEIAEVMSNDGFRFLKSKLEIKKKTNRFVFRIYSQSSRWNAAGETAEVFIRSSVCDGKENICFWDSTLAFSNAKQDVGQWELYGKENYEESLRGIKEIISSYLLPFFRRFEHDLPKLTEEVAEKGFCAFGPTQVYDANYEIPIGFLSEYGNKEQINLAFQNYIDRHELPYVRDNMHNAITLLLEGKEVINNGERDYAEYAVKNDLELIF